MAADVRQRMVEGAIQLLATQGLQGASFGNLLELTGAPRGSIYHHFPGGKAELVDAAIDLAGARAVAALEDARGEPAVRIAERFVGLWRRLLEHTGYSVGCSVLGTVVTADAEATLDRAAGVFRAWRATLAGLLVAGGVPAGPADRLALLLIASCEGAVVLSRAERSSEPLDTVGTEVLARIEAAATAR